MPVIGADGIRQLAKTLVRKQLHQFLIDLVEQSWSGKDKRRIDLHKRGTGLNLFQCCIG